MNNSDANRLTPRGRYGAVYVAFGTPHVAMALVSATTLRNANPDLPVHIVSNLPKQVGANMPFWDETIDRWSEVNDAPANNRMYKIGLHSFVEFERAVYLDADTLVTGDLSLAFLYLDYFDVCIRAHRGRQTHSHLAKVPLLDDGLTVQDLPHWNGGVLFFRNNEETRQLFASWHDAFLQIGEKFDQPALAKALIESRCRILSLDERWNGGFRSIADDKGGVAFVAHYHSALDEAIEDALRKTGRLISGYVPHDARDEVETYISRCRQLRRENEPLKSAMRRRYRSWWHRKHRPLAPFDHLR